MVYPPGTRPTNNTDDTGSGTGHHADALHNGDGRAINDIVTELGPKPRGASQNLTDRLAGMSARNDGIRQWRSGMWVSYGIVPSNVSAPLDQLNLFPVFFEEDVLVDQFTIWVATAGAAGARFDSLVYADDGSFYPGALRAVDTHNCETTGLKTSATYVNGVLMPAGVSWIGGRSHGVASTIVFAFGNAHTVPMVSAPTTSYATGGVALGAQATNPNPFPAGGVAVVSGPRVGMRLK